MAINKKLLLKLVKIPSPSGNELLMKRFLFDYGKKNLKNTDIFLDSGELFYFKRSSNPFAKTILFDAHIDHISLRIMSITNDGFLICRCFGVNKSDIFGKSVRVLTKNGLVNGIITINPPHLGIKNNQLLVDIFAKNAEEANKIVEIGDSILLTPTAKINGDFLTGTSLDNHIGVYTLLNVAEQIDKIDDLSNNIIFHFSSREETGGLKYISMMDDISGMPTKIDLIFVVDADLSNDVYNLKRDDLPKTALGLGPIITRNISDDYEVYRFITSIIGNIPYQIVMSEGDGGNNLIDYSKTSSLGQSIGIPLRYMHSSVETCRLNDIEWTIQLIYQIIINLDFLFDGEKKI